MKTTTALSLNQAAKAAKKSKASILEALKNGRLSGSQDEQGHWQIEPVELFRCFDQNQFGTGNENRRQPPIENQSEPPQNQVETILQLVQSERQREREQMQAEMKRLEDVIDDLRHRLDRESEERRKLTMMLTHQPDTTRTEAPEPNDALLKKLFRGTRGLI